MTGKQPADNLKLIKGIGPAIERRLHKANITTFAQLAEMSPTAIAQAVEGQAGMSPERITQLNWVGQARTLTSEPAVAEIQPRVKPSANHQHYATFTVELLLDEENNTRRTRIVHIQSEKEGAWAGWHKARMIRFITEQAALQLPKVEPTPALIAETVPNSTSGTLQLHELETTLPGEDNPCKILHHNQPFLVRFTLDFSEVMALGDRPLDYTAAVCAKSLSGGPRQTLAETRGAIMPKESPTITIQGRPLPQGLYRLEAVATLALPTAGSELTARLEGDLLQIY